MQTFNATQLTDILGDLLLAPVPAEVVIARINTDTRTLQRGDSFVALSGERFDGHDYIETAVANHVANVVVERPQNIAVPQVVVKDTRLALAKLASKIRQDFSQRGGKIIGLTGSAGKTTNKQMLAAIFAQVGNMHATKGNLNNDLGVPFTWFDLPDEAAYAVIEMGANHQQEIAYLAAITRPDVAMITNAGAAHLEGFGGIDGVAKGKGELFEQLSDGQVAVINADDAYADYWRGLLADNVGVKTFTFANNTADVFAKDVSADGSRFTLCHGKDHVVVQLPTVGKHNVSNALGSAACALALDVSLANIAKGLSQFETAKGRLQKYHVGSLTLIDDTYNANPLSMRASAEILSVADGFRLMVLGDMGELGDDELALHTTLGEDLADKADAFFCFGQRMQAFVAANDKTIHFDDLTTLNQRLIEKINHVGQATVLVKGSRSMQMERVVAAILQAQK